MSGALWSNSLLAATDAASTISSTNVWTYVFVTVTFMVYLYIGWRSRVRETQGFYVAGQGVPAIANGAATAADWMSAASFMGMTGIICAQGYAGCVYLMGWTGGYVLLALLLAPYLRKFGQYTVPDFVGARYYSETARVVAAICAIFVSLTYVAGQMRGVGIVFSRFLGVEVWQGVVVGMVIVAFFAVLGGMKGITWTQVAQFFVLILAFLIPSFAVSGIVTGNYIPQLGITQTDVAEKLNQIQIDLGMGSYTQPFTNTSMLNVACITFALMAGTAGLPHVIVRFYTVGSVRAARFSAGWALLFISMLYLTAPALAIFAQYNLIQKLDGKTVEEVEALPWVQTWTKTNLLVYGDKNGDGKISMAYGTEGLTGDAFYKQVAQDRKAFVKDDKTGEFVPNPKTPCEVYIDRDIYVLSAPEIASLHPAIIALVVAGALAAALSTAAGLLLVISSSAAHDLYVHFFDKDAPEPRRLLVGRIMILIAIVFAGYFGINPPGFVAQVVAFAFGLAAASFFPVILLGIFDKRTTREGAISGMIAGIAFTAAYIVGVKWNLITGMTATSPLPWYRTTWFFGISAEGIGTVGCALNFVITFVVSRLTQPPPQEVQDLVESVRVPEGAHGPEAHYDEYDVGH